MNQLVELLILHNGKYEAFNITVKSGDIDKITEKLKEAITSDPDTVDGIFIYKDEDSDNIIIIPPNVLKNSIIKIKKINN